MAALISVKFDASSVKNLARALDTVSKDMREKVLCMGVNKAAAKGKTVANREIARAGGFKYGYVANHTNLYYASPSNLTARITGNRRYSNLIEFKANFLRESCGGITASPWNQTRVWPHAFVARGANGANLVFERKSKARFPLKPMWGAGVGREMQRDSALVPIRTRIAESLVTEITRAYNYKVYSAAAGVR